MAEFSPIALDAEVSVVVKSVKNIFSHPVAAEISTLRTPNLPICTSSSIFRYMRFCETVVD